MEVEAVRDAGRDEERGGRLRGELDRRSQPLGGRPFADVVEPDRRPPGDDGEVVPMAPVNMDASEHVRLGTHCVPLHGRDREAPRLAEELGEDASLVGVSLERVRRDTLGQHARIMTR